MPKIRILVVDDSVVVRRMVSDVLAADPQLEIAGTAANGKIALAKIPQVNPDIVILDVEMPELDGIGTLVEIRKMLPKLCRSSCTAPSPSAARKPLSMRCPRVLRTMSPSPPTSEVPRRRWNAFGRN